MKTYTVQRGDTLFIIAERFYGDGHKYQLLALYNFIENPNVLEVGQILKIPPIEDLQAASTRLRGWHNYQNGSIYWRVTEQGVEIQGKGLLKKQEYSRQAVRIWTEYKKAIVAASQKHGVPIPVIIATISTESSGAPKAYRYEPNFYERYIKDKSQWKDNLFYHFPKRISASYGLMQIMYTTAYSVGFRDEPEELYVPATNIDVGAAYIASPFQKKSHGWDPPKIACAYNAGSVRPTGRNDWGMFYHADHLDRWIPAYNGAIEIVGIENLPEPPEPVKPEEAQPQPAEPVVVPEETPIDQFSTLRFLFSGEGRPPWKPLIVDVFKHGESGLGDPGSYTIDSPTYDPSKGYVYEIHNIERGVYDFVFADAASGSIVYDIADHNVDGSLEILDLRQNRSVYGEQKQQDQSKEGGIWAMIRRFLERIFS